jgi:hypothetical protein
VIDYPTSSGLNSTSTFPRAAFSGAIAPILAPYIGPTMARASVDSQLDKVGLPGEDLTAPQLETLINKLGGGLNVFLGRSRAKVVVEAMKAALPSIRVP